MNPGVPTDRSGPSAVSSSPPTPASAHSGRTHPPGLAEPDPGAGRPGTGAGSGVPWRPGGGPPGDLAQRGGLALAAARGTVLPVQRD